MTSTTIPLGFAIDSGEPVSIPLRHTVITGQTQEAGKTTTLEALVVGGVERDGRVKARVVMSTKKEELAKHVEAMVDHAAHLHTDQLPTYKSIGEQFAAHHRIRHNAGQYVRYTLDGVQVTTNRIEGFWAGLKRQIGGTHHAVSRKHLHRYVSEAEFKYNNRNMNDGERTVKLIRAAVDRRLTYRMQTERPRDEKGRYRWR